MSLTWPLALTALALVPIAVWALPRARPAAAQRGVALRQPRAAARARRRATGPPAPRSAAARAGRADPARRRPRAPARHALAAEGGGDRRARDGHLALDGGQGRQAERGWAPPSRRPETFLDKVPDRYRVAIVSFSTKAEVVLPPTTDRDAARDAAGTAPPRHRDGDRRRGRTRALARGAAAGCGAARGARPTRTTKCSHRRCHAGLDPPPLRRRPDRRRRAPARRRQARRRAEGAGEHDRARHARRDRRGPACPAA